ASLYLVDLYRVGVDYLEAVCKLRLICLDRELVSSGISMGWIDVFSGGLVAKECLSENKIRSGPLRWCLFWFFHWCSAYIRRVCVVAPLLRVSVRLVQRPDY
ncbi:hypothetical protein A2U01_0022145, partial [Trifolium medium]|nr:hypothetical protein [Trifolium medium]